MNYRHIYHAGNRADLIKHLTLAHLLLRLCEKDTPFAVLDTHAGAGNYDLSSVEAQKTKEAAEGAAAFFALPPHPALAPLQEILKKLNGATLHRYPGSPVIARQYLRENDRLILVEKHPEEFKKLRTLFAADKPVLLHERDAWEAVNALLPLPEKRLLVFIDPPYEQPDEMDKALQAILKAYSRVSNALYALWYPITDAIAVARMKEKLANSDIKKMLSVDVEHAPQNNLKGCGMILINPPWQIENVLKDACEALRPLYSEGASIDIEWLKLAD
jgi:23S rRNA (adenine2030-N6)-methyltransferase